jgi:hypothetical protein
MRIAIHFAAAVCFVACLAVAYRAAAAEHAIPYELHGAGAVSLGIYDGQGGLVRMLASGQPCAAGRQVASWDGLDDQGRPVPVGSYTLKGLRSGVGCNYMLTFGAEGRPPWPTADGKGAWGALWGNVMGVAADPQGFVYLVWYEEEGEGAILKVKPDGGENDFVQWKQHKEWNWGRGVDLATDGDFVYVLCGGAVQGDRSNPRTARYQDGVLRLRKSSGELAFYPGQQGSLCPVGRIYQGSELIPAWAEVMTSPRPLVWTLAGEYADPTRRRGPPSVQYHTSARGIAAHGGCLYVSLYLDDRIAVLDAPSGKPLREIGGIPRPQGIAAGRDGTLYVASENRVLRVSPSGAVSVAVDHDLTAPYGVALDGQDRLYVTDQGDSMQVKLFSPDGKLLRVLGRKGGRAYQGAWEPQRESFLYPGHPAVDTQGRLYVPEDDTVGRVAILHDGQLQREWFGPHGGGCGMPVVADPQQPEFVYHTPSGGDLVRYRLDYTKRTWTIDAYWNGCTKFYDGGLKPGYLALNHWRDMFVRHYQGHIYLILTTPWCFYRVEGAELIPCAVVGNTHDGWLIGPLSQGWKRPIPADHGRTLYCWRDRNADGRVQEDEVDRSISPALEKAFAKTDTLALGYSGYYVDDDLNLYNHDPRTQLATLPASGKDMGTGTLWKLPCQGLDPAGSPIYSWSQAEPLLENKLGLVEIDFARLDVARLAGQKARVNPQACYRDGAGNSYFVWHTIGHQDVGINWAAMNSVARVGRFDADGRLRWIVGRKATSIARPGEMYVPHTVAGVAQGCVFIVDRNAQIRVFDAETGLYAGSLLNDIYQGVMPDQNTLTLTHELVQAQVLEHPRLGQTYLIVGDYSGPRCYQVTGLEAIEHFTSPVTVTTPPAPREPAAAADDRPRPQRKTLVISPAPAKMIIDGRLDEWNQDTAVELAADPQRKDLRGRCLAAWDQDFLYVAYDVEDSSPMRNAGDDPSMAFKTGDTVEFFLGTDTAADPDRREPTAHDYRVLMTCLRGDRPVVVGFHPIGPGKPRLFTHPSGTWGTRMDEIGLIPGSQLAVMRRPDGSGYTAEAKIPWQYFGLHPTPPLRLAFNFAVNFSDASGQKNVAKIHWNGPNFICTDVPSELRLNPWAWGWAELEPAGAAAGLHYDGTLLNSGEAGPGLVDFAWQQTGDGGHTSIGGDGLFFDREGNLWTAGADGVGQALDGYLYKYSPQGHVLAKYLIGSKLSLASKLAGDERYLYFLACLPGGDKKRLCRLDRAAAPPGKGAEEIHLADVPLTHGNRNQIAGNLFQGKLLLSEGSKVVRIDPATGQCRDALTFSDVDGFRTERVMLVDVDPQTGTVLVNRSVGRAGGPAIHGLMSRYAESFAVDGKPLGHFTWMHFGPTMDLCCWDAGLAFSGQQNYLLVDTRFSARQLATEFIRYTRGDFLGAVNQVRIGPDGNVYAAGSEGRTVMVYSPRGEAVRRIGALRTAALAKGPKESLWFLVPEGGLSAGGPQGRGGEAIGVFSAPAVAAADAPPHKAAFQGAQLADLAGLVVGDDGTFLRLCLATDAAGRKTAWEIRKGGETQVRGRNPALWATGRFAPGAIGTPTGLAEFQYAGEKPYLYLADSERNTVVCLPVFATDTELTPQTLKLTDAKGKPLALQTPQSLAFDAAGRLYLATTDTILCFDRVKPLAYRLCRAIAGFGPGGRDHIAGPRGICVDRGEIFVADTGNHRVLRLAADGTCRGSFGEKGAPGADREHLNHPTALIVIGARIYVADEGNYRIVRLRR